MTDDESRTRRRRARPHTRRRFLTAAGAAGAVALAGCSAEQVDDGGDGGDGGGGNGTDDGGSESGDGGDETPTLTVATYTNFIDAPSVSPGEWLKEEFESRYDATLEWATPDNEVNYYVERAASGAGIDADLYVGLTTEDLVRVDGALDEDLFAEAGDVDGRDAVKEGLRFDPFERAVPFDTGYVSLVYDSTTTEAPETFDGLLDDEHAGALIAQNPGGSATGRAFLLHTISRFGDGGVASDGDGEAVAGGDGDPDYDYLDYWAELQANDVRVLGSWDDAYAAWSEGEAPIVVSYSTDQVFADMEGADLQRHQIRFLNDQAYANPEGMALFADADEPDLAREFMSFMLEPDVQGEIAQRNVAFPSTDGAELPSDYAELAKEPADPVTFTYDELQGSVDAWVEAWERQYAGN
ncbi:thiamine ABC transporter substrate-binding protein [Halorubrum ezzemoulense]|uniref:thiamine ABC transporter substrate-binding protein n=1 Tax=Halorubrum ezzemoulense TaxID=337243 RepID=UPI0023314624|nr:thiamine ABC transporter substrate-binding protein [Halorubrum ezzemoulense]MDB9249011.1 thiamine ABC transporter substrate-binding protein [Halorubrum ezzemoulense]MDB9260138.1 thiamine ABC transporter substrate-binding protein [Halorubrum ezzemoulense]MDB9262771.1 thiamine ABC transporter substrate-binding protein [Halorubrum ezzemoulense]MDB9265670.1 thiamine ABC transporter substrate-binding protein [Halorubrum ezzemoulense]MDB9270499.1 thiamine ABC transporter substrate-binding protein